MNKIDNKDDYFSFLDNIKQRIRHAQYEAMRAVNTEIIALYWEIGRSIAEKQSNGWGKSVVEQLSNDIQTEFPGIKGFGSRNIWYMVQFYTEYQVDKKLQPLVAEIYLNVINDTMRLPHENPALGIIICKSKNRTVVEYALRNSTIPIGVATYSISPNLPDDYKNLLPEADKIAERLRNLEASVC